MRTRGLLVLSLAVLSAETGFTAAAIERMISPFLNGGLLARVAGDRLVSRQSLTASIDFIHATLLKRFSGGVNAGVKRSELKSATELESGVFDLSIECLLQQGRIIVQGENVFPRDSESGYSLEDQKKMSAIEEIYQNAGLASPSSSEAGNRLSLSEREMHRLVTFLLREKILVRLGNDPIYIHQTALGSLKEMLASLKGESLDVGRFKSITGLSRKYAIPLLEYLDREHLTKKQGDSRLVL